MDDYETMIPTKRRSTMMTRKRWTPEEIKALRKSMKLTQAEFAKRLGYSRRETVTDLEKGRYAPSGPARLHLDRLGADADAHDDGGDEP